MIILYLVKIIGKDGDETMFNETVIVRGGGDIASGTIQKLHKVLDTASGDRK